MTNTQDAWINIGNRLRIARGGMSQRAAGALMGLSAQSISLIERGKIRSNSTRLLRFAKVYDSSLSFFLHSGEPPKLTPAPWGPFKRRTSEGVVVC